jgi:hypothetical protein
MGPCKEDVAAIAQAACLAHQSGAETYTRNGIVFDLVTGGWCGRFVRQCYVAAKREFDPEADEFGFSWLRRYAAEACQALEEMGYHTDHPQPGDIIGMSPGGRLPGHIGIYLGNRIAENTSSTVRGPGTVLSPLSSVRSAITGYYAVYPSRTASDLQVVGLDNQVVPCHPSEEQGVTRADLRPVVEALGFACEYRVHEDGRRRVYLKTGGRQGDGGETAGKHRGGTAG